MGALAKLSNTELQLELLGRAIVRTNAAIQRAEGTLAVLKAKRRRQELEHSGLWGRRASEQAGGKSKVRPTAKTR